MKDILSLWMALMLPSMSIGCDVCGIFLGIQPRDRTSSFSLLWRYRRLVGALPAAPPWSPSMLGMMRSLPRRQDRTTVSYARWLSSAAISG